MSDKRVVDNPPETTAWMREQFRQAGATPLIDRQEMVERLRAAIEALCDLHHRMASVHREAKPHPGRLVVTAGDRRAVLNGAVQLEQAKAAIEAIQLSEQGSGSIMKASVPQDQVLSTGGLRQPATRESSLATRLDPAGECQAQEKKP